MMPIMDNVTIIGTNCRVASGRIGNEKRMNPYVPIFRSTAARITEPAVGASVCASGNHVWNGNIGTLTANPRKNARKTQNCSLSPASDDDKFNCWNCVMSNVYTPVTL